MYILGDKIGEGHHASVYKCFKLVNPLTKSEKKNILFCLKICEFIELISQEIKLSTFDSRRNFVMEFEGFRF